MADKANGKKHVLKKALIGFLAVVVIFSAASMVFIKIQYDKNFPRYDPPKYSGYLQYGDVQGYPRSVVNFNSGSNTLTGYVYGEGNQKGLVVIAPGRGEGTEKYLPQTLYFVDHGWRVFTFDYTGNYASQGKNSVGLPQARLDLKAALAYIQSSPEMQGLPLLLWGHSWGGYAVAAVLSDHPDITAVASVSGFNSPMGLMTEYLANDIGVLGYLEYPFVWAYQTRLFGREAGATAVGGINSTTTPVMIIHGSADEAISYHGASIMAQRAAIINPHVIYTTYSTANHNGHFSVFQSQAAIEYIHQKNQEYKTIAERYQGAVPDSAKAEFYAGVDPFKTSELDAQFMDAINEFFERAVAANQ